HSPSPLSTPSLHDALPIYTACVTKRVLIVDDEPPVVEVLKDFFRQFRHPNTYETTSAKDGAEALIVLLRGQFDLILLDMHMPRIDRKSTRLNSSHRTISYA